MKNHYRYFQRGEQTPWIPTPADGAERTALAEGAKRLTVLSTSKALGGLDGETAPKDLRYFGPFYVDIDNKENMKAALEAGVLLADRLIEEYGVDTADIQVFLSGSKGVHILLEPSCFGLDRPVVRLPRVYMEMAKLLYVSGMDMQVYSMRNAMRLPNVKRDDGNYRVQVTVDELRELTPGKYKELVSAPRHAKIPRPTGRLYAQLSALFEGATEIAKRADRPIEDKSQVYAPVLRETFKEEVPPCLQACAEGKVDETKNFNQVAMQVAIFAARMNPDGLGTFKPVFDRIADNVKSSQYSSPRARRDHLEGAFQYARVNDKYNFSCNAMRSVMKHRVCGDCPIEAVKVIESPEDAAKVVGIAVKGDGYFDDSQKSPRRLSTFILRPEHVFNQMMEDGVVRRVGTVASVETNGQQLGSVLLDENSWSNRQAFLRALNGLSNLSYFGSESDLQKIKFVTMSDADLPEKTMVRELGLHITKIGDKEIRTYVEKGRSFNSLRIRDSFSFEGDSLYQPFLFDAEKVRENDQEAQRGLHHLLELNDPLIMAVLVGWGASCHLKPHLNHLYRQFPPVNLWGNMRTGKTTTAGYSCVIGGVDFVSEHEVMNIPASTPYTWLESLSNSTSVPMIWDEVNRSGERMSQKMYAKACEYLKACWNGQAAHKGTLSQTARTGMAIRTYRMVRPVVYCSEQQPDLPALNDRSITLMLTKEGRDSRRHHMFELRENLDGLKRIAHTLMIAAIQTPTSAVAERFRRCDELLAEKLSDRQRYGIACSLMGLDWLGEILTAAGNLTEELAVQLETAKQAIIAHSDLMADEEVSRDISTEVDRAFGEIFEVIDNSIQASQDAGLGIPLLRAGTHFMFKAAPGASFLYLDVRTAHSAYLVHCRRKGVNVMLDDLRNFTKLAMQEDYVGGLITDEDYLEGRHCLVINLTKAQRRGLPVSLLGRENMNEF